MKLPRQVRLVARKVNAPHEMPRAKARFLRAVSRSPTLSGLYSFFRRSYVREQQAMLAGMAKYHEIVADEAAIPVYELRRNIHRLEKGLVATPRREVFAESYIGETVADFARLAGSPLEAVDEPLRAWAAEVLERYFAGVKRTPVVEAAERAFRLAHPTDLCDSSRGPSAKDVGPPPVSYEDLYSLVSRRRSVRRFADSPVPRRLLDDAVAAAAQSPSACNRQAFEFRMYDQADLVDAVAGMAPGFDPKNSNLRCIVAVVGKYRAYYRERDQHVIYIDASLATMAFLLALETRGLASCCINWPSIRSVDARMTHLLSLDDDEEVVLLIAVGYPAADAISPHSEKARIDELRSYNRA